MNLTTAIDTMRHAIALDHNLEISTALQSTLDSLASLASNPSEPNVQTAVRRTLDNLANRLSRVEEELSEANANRLVELGATDLFPIGMYGAIMEHVNANIATPTVSQQYVQNIVSARSEILRSFASVIEVAEARNWALEPEIDGFAEVGFTVPREIFDNKLKGLTKEFDWINRFVSSLTEATTGRHEDFEVSRLSTTDPTLFIVASYAITVTVGKVTTWAINTWKSVEEIRHLRAETSKLTAFSPQEVEQIFGNKIKTQVSEEIEQQASMLTANVSDESRKNELHSGLSIMLNQFLQRVERGMTVEIRLIGHNDDLDTELDDADELIEDLDSVASDLAFPSASKTPVLQLTGGASEGDGAIAGGAKIKPSK